MKLSEYITKYRGGIPALTSAEARIIGLKFPLVKDWFKKSKDIDIDLSALITARGKGTASKRKKKVAADKRERKAERIRIANTSPIFSSQAVSEAVEVFRTDQYEYANDPAFLSSFEWKQIRFKVLQKYGRRCQCCGASPSTGAVMNVDHIKPRRKFPHLALDIKNLQVLCSECNHGKGNQTADFR